MPTFTVTATQGGSTANGLALRVFVLTQAAATQNGATANALITSSTAFTTSITTTQTGSRVYGAANNGNNNSFSAAALTTLVDDIADAVNTARYGTFKATSLTGTPGATTLGLTAAAVSSGPLAMAEIKTAGTLTEDASGPAVASTTSATSVTTANFTPPSGALLVALVASDGGAGVTTMALSDTSGLGLTWTELVKNNVSGFNYAGVWITQLPAGGVAGSVQPQATVPVPRRRPARGLWGGVRGQAFVQVPAPAQQYRLAPRRKSVRAVWGGITGPAFVFVPAPRQEPYLPPRRVPGRAVWRGSVPFTGFTAVPAPRQPPPTVFRRVLARGWWRGGPVPPFVTVALRQGPYLPPRRKSARAVVQFTPVVTVNAAAAPPVSGSVQPRPTVAVPRRRPGRGLWGGVQGQAFVMVPAPRQLPVYPRRKLVRAVVEFRAVVTVNATFMPRGQPQPAPDDKPYLKKLFYLTD